MNPPNFDPEFVKLLTNHQPALHAYTLSLVRRPADADDVLQNTNVVLWEKRTQFTLGTNFKAWAFKIARLQTMAWHKKHRKFNLQIFDDELLDRIAEEAPQVLTDFSERHSALQACLQNLAPSQRELLLKRYTERASIKEFAASVNRSAGSLRITLFRIRQSLKSCIRQRINSAP